MRMPPLSMPSMYSLRPLSSGKNNAVPPKGKRKDEDDDSDDEKEGETRREKIKEKLIHLKEEIKEEIDETKVSHSLSSCVYSLSSFDFMYLLLYC